VSVLGRDVAPGDPAAVRAVAGRLRQRGDALLAEADGLASLPRAQWEGAAAASFTALALTLPDDLRRSAAAAAGAAAALEGYARTLASAQAVLPGLRARADEASRQLARTLLPRPSADPFGPPDPAALQAERDQQAAQRELSALRREAERLATAVDDAGRAAARALDAAREQLPDLSPLLARAVTGLSEVADASWEDVKRFAGDHAEGLQTTADVLAVVGLAAMAASIVCPPLAAVAAGTRVAQLALAASRAGAVAGQAASWGGVTANSAVVAGTPHKTVTDLWPDALAIGTLGASRALTAPARLVRGKPSRWNIATARAADSRLAPTAAPTRPGSWPSGVSGGARDVPSIWSLQAAIGPNELVMRSVRFAVDSPNAVVGTVGGVTAAGGLHRTATGRPAPPTPGRSPRAVRTPAQRTRAEQRRQVER
jgi:hypothetical protein